MYELYSIAEQQNIEIYRRSIPLTVSMTVPGAICLDKDLIFDGKQERTNLGHELGHNMRNAFYSRNDPQFIRKRMENEADKWEIKKLIPKDKLKEAVKLGYTDEWQLSDYFNVTEELIRKAFCLYEYGNLGLEYYFTL